LPLQTGKGKVESSVSDIRGKELFGAGAAYALLSEIIPRPDTPEADAAVLLLAHALADLYFTSRKG
jgi:hypothetical protein